MNRRRLKNAVLKYITAFSVAIIFGLSFDHGDSIFPAIIVYLAAVVWLALFSYANSYANKEEY